MCKKKLVFSKVAKIRDKQKFRLFYARSLVSKVKHIVSRLVK